MANDAPVFYDCEATGLDGFPIEVGWAFADANSSVIISEDCLIRPPQDWPIEECWDPAAEALHGISLERLRASGHSTWDIAGRMNRSLEGRELFSDSPFDEDWLRRIFAAAGCDPSFSIRRTDAELMISRLAASRGLNAAAYAQARSNAVSPEPRAQRAGADARRLTALWHEVSRASGALR
jgi:hypothetical protein